MAETGHGTPTDQEIEMTPSSHPTLEEQRAEFARSRFLAMPIAGTIAWTAIGICGALLPVGLAAWALFIGTGSIFGLGLVVARLIGEDLLGKTRPNNAFDDLFFHTIIMAWLVFSIAIPFYMLVPTSLPLTVGILSGLMWIPFSWLIQHWVGLFHGIARTALIVVAWYLFPGQRFVVIPAIIVAIYLVTICILIVRTRRQVDTSRLSVRTAAANAGDAAESEVNL